MMADSNRIVFPDEVEEAKANALTASATEDKTSGGDKNTVEETPKEISGITMRNVAVTPNNCPPGHKMGPDGVCREVFN